MSLPVLYSSESKQETRQHHLVGPNHIITIGVSSCDTEWPSKSLLIYIYTYYYRRAVLKIRQISSRAAAMRQRSWRRFFSAYFLPICELCATAFFILLSFVFCDFFNNNLAFSTTRCLRCMTDGSA